jgi:hypothetical protein
MPTLSEQFETINDLFPGIRWRATLSDGNATVQLTYADIGHLEDAVVKAVENFRMQLVNFYPIDGNILEN